MIEPKHLIAIGGCSKDRAEALADPLNDAMARFDITPGHREQMFLAQAAHESGGFKHLVEIWGPTKQQQAYEPPSLLSQRLGNLYEGDGYKYRGRGLFQLTGRFNYEIFTRDMEGDIDFLSFPDFVAEPKWAAMSAAWYWSSKKLNGLADANAFRNITIRINGGLTGQDSRKRYLMIAKTILK